MRPLQLRLKWKRGVFVVMIAPGREPEPAEVEGIISPPFGIYHGDVYGQDVLGTRRRFTLSLLSCRQRIATLSMQIDCKRLALELAALRVYWDEPDARDIHGDDLPRAREIIRLYKGPGG